MLLINLIIYYVYDCRLLVDYLLGGTLFLLCTLFLFPKYYNINRLVDTWFILGPIYISIFIIVLWNYSCFIIIWLFLTPLGAYMFFSLKKTIYYTIFTFIYVVILSIISHYIGPFKSLNIDNDGIFLIDIVTIINYFLNIVLLLVYKNKINRAQYNAQNQQEIEKLINIRKKYLQSEFTPDELAKYNELFIKISEYMEEKQPFKKSDFTISELSSALNSNSSYVSRAIRMNGFSNFNNFMNSYRINYVKQQLLQNRHQQYTLCYIYTEAGFTHQSTFNRIFKDFTELTPSQYILEIKNIPQKDL
ncbi:helix-turn-helix domain-containing protein [Apibacter sp. HY039]|uniref:helix-turn-helix domain-containing protein n=1 Tax=Apibacter sp. HY039 TaxID=2501476 RepID=UPI000FEBA5A3|nr:helix-turn-helix domain-containing protein [Apibacter sp. HY039]